MKNIATIKITGIEIFAKHGVKESEHNLPQKFLVDVSYRLRTNKSSKTDNIEDTVSYSDVQKTVIETVLGEHCDLIEKLAEDILQNVMNIDKRIISAKIKLHKPEAPLSNKFKDVSIKVSSA